MRKMIFTFMLTIVSSVWTMSSALCIARAPQMQQSTETLSGYFVMEGTPCESTVEPCLPCLTLAFQSNETLYYLTSDNDQMMSQLNEIEAQFIEGQHATINGISYQQGSYNYINVQTVSIANSPLPSLCDEWNVLEHLTALGPDYESFGTLHFRLTSDTMINATHYVRLEQDGTYKGALREGTNADIYYVPNNSTHEYLLYAFNAQVGDSLENLWFGANEIDRFIIKSATVVNIESTTPRKFTIGFEWQSVYSYAAINDTSEIMYAELVWLEGVGFQFGGPLSYECPFDCAGGPGLLTLCAYKNGEKVYADPYWSEKVGCEYNRHTLPSLCDEWNVWYESFESFGPISFDKVVKYQLTTDTLINGQQYVKLASDKDSPYLGAMREGNNRDIYYIPANSTHEYLLYAFNAQVGDTLSNLWIGVTFFEEAAYQGVVQSISNDNPRIFTIQVKDIYQTHEDTTTYPIYWIEGVGSLQTPYGMEPTPTSLADVGVYTLLCAYKNKEQIYVSEMGAEYGCEHDQTPEPTDTIPLYSYTGDDPGSSTVDPVDPNQVVATLQGDQLTIRENMGVDITYSLQTNAPAQTPAQHRAPQNDTFRNEVRVQITESGEYLLQLTNPSWGYTIFGRFNYSPQGIEITKDQSSIINKVIRDGRLLILRGDKTYTVTGQEVR